MFEWHCLVCNKSYDSLKKWPRHGSNGCVLDLHRADEPCLQSLEEDFALDAGAERDFVSFIESMIDCASRKILEEAPPDVTTVRDVWFYCRQHLLAHFILDRPFWN